MGFFDLNIPYETLPSSKATRIKLVIKAMELGYSGIAYNRTIKGVMSDHDRCCIAPLSLSSLLDLAPSLSASINLHRDLLNVPRASPFRQYTRLTVCVGSPAQSQVLNKGNMILKTYDVVAVRPLNQLAFDAACEKSEVDIIAIYFSEKLPFRLKLHMVKAAVERGVYFEITYSDLIMDVQVRRQMISTAKLLVDWTRGKNLIISSAAPSVNELRGPYDVANISSLLGLSMERAKVAISKNCRNLIANALRKKHFYKETIRVEPVSLDGNSNSNDPFSMDWLKWDPISSGEGDIHLEDIAKSFSNTTRQSSSVKAIDFASVIDSKQSHGTNFLTAAKAVEVSVVATAAAEEIRAPTNATEEELKVSDVSDAVLPSAVAEKHGLQSQNLIPGKSSTRLASQDVIHQTSPSENVLTDTHVTGTKMGTSFGNANFLESDIEKSTHSHSVLGTHKVVMEKNKEQMATEDQDDAPVTENLFGRNQLMESHDAKITINNEVPFTSISCEVNLNNDFSVANRENLDDVIVEEQLDANPDFSKEVAVEGQEHGDADAEFAVLNEVIMEEQRDATPDFSKEVAVGEQEHGYVDAEFAVLDEVIMEEQQDANPDFSEEVAVEGKEHGDADAEFAVLQDNDFKDKDDSSIAKVVPFNEVAVEEIKLDLEAHIESSNHQSVVPSLPGKSKSKQRTSLLFPLKRLLNPLSFKRKSKKFKRKMKV